MADKTFSTRIQNKYDTYANWASANPIPLAGEVCVVVVPAQAGAVAQEPAILFKVGNGTDHFNSLPFAGALAADVYGWAKEAQKPSYTADEISGLADYIAGKVEDTDTQYKLEQDSSNPHVIKFMSQTKGASGWTEVGSITTADTVYNDADLQAKVISLLNRVGDTGVSEQIAAAIAELNLANTYASKEEAQGYANAKDADIADAKKAGDDAQSAVDALDTRVQANETAIATLNGTGAGSIQKTVADALVEFAAGADEDYNTLVEISDWILSHKPEATAMNSAINKLEGLVGETAVATQISNAIDAALKTGGSDKYALASALAGALDRISANETAINGKANTDDLAAVAISGDIADLTQASGYIIFDCGSATKNI